MTEKPRISLRQARIIDAVARTRSIDEAARTLGTTQSVASRAIAEAESALGVSLFQRGWSGADLTPWGEILCRHCASALGLISRAEDDLALMQPTRPNLLNHLKWQHLDVVAAVARFDSASAAAAELGMTQSAVSRAIAAISEYCRGPLFERRRHGLEPTPQARCIAILRSELFEALGDIDMRRADPKAGLVGRLAVGISPFSGQDFVAKAFGQFTKRYPGVKLSAVGGSHNMLAGALRRGEIDCMVGVLRNPPLFPDFREAFLYNEEFVLIARDDHPCHARKQELSALRDERWIVTPPGTSLRSYFDNLFQAIGTPSPAQLSEILSFGNAERMIIETNSIGLMSYTPRHLENLPEGLKKIDIDLPSAEIAVGITARRLGGPAEILAVFTDILADLTSPVRSTAEV